MSFEEFLHNDPSITSEFNLEKKQYDGHFSNIKISFEDKSLTGSTLRKSWGVSDGDSIYVNSLNYQQEFHFDRLVFLGRYCYIENTTSYSNAPSTGAGISVGLYRSNVKYTGYILNINNGKFYKLEEEALEKILEKDADLLHLYQGENKKGNVQERLAQKARYIQLYNERHSDEIKQ